MNLSIPHKSKSKAKNTILFVCVENAARSQMAEAFFRKYAPNDYDAESAGTKLAYEINPAAIKVMDQIDIDIRKQKPKELTEDMIKNATKTINMGCLDKNVCPALFAPKNVDWGIEDPNGKPIEKVAEIRDEIEQRVRELIDVLNREKKEW